MCQSPIYRDTHFYADWLQSTSWKKLHVSIPYLSGHPFLRRKSLIVKISNKCVNPLSIGTPISTYCNICSSGNRLVSIPYLSGHPFLLLFDEFYIHIATNMCQSPIYRDTHFYRDHYGTRNRNEDVSIPYLSGHPFLRTRRRIMKDVKVCQSPIYRDTHFYSFARVGRTRNSTSPCQSPIYRDTHFYCSAEGAVNSYIDLCQSPIHRDTHFYA